MRALIASLGVLALLASGCGGDESAEDVLAETADNLSEIRSGNLSFRLVVEPKGAGEDSVGFELKGPFSLSGEGPLPVARIEYTQIRGSNRGSVTVISTGRKAFVESNGTTYELPPGQTRELRQAGDELKGGEGLGELSLDDWIVDPEISDGGNVGGAETDRVDASLDVSAAVRDLASLAGTLGSDALSDADAETVERATRSAELQLYTGAEDRLLRRLLMSADLGFDVPAQLRELLGQIVGANIDFELSVDKPNTAVKVAEPAEARPYAELVPGP